jgi:hypothetical protein
MVPKSAAYWSQGVSKTWRKEGAVVVEQRRA